MDSIYSSKETVSYLRNFQRITQTYQEIAAVRMQRVKHSVLQNREYLDETRSIYHEVVNSYKEYVAQRLKDEEKASLRDKDKKVSILLSANTKLYGAIIKKVFEAFYAHIKESETDVVIIGKTGLQMYKETHTTKPYQYFDLPDDILTPEALAEIITAITKYEEIIVFHSQFEDILTQIVKKTALTPERYQAKSDGTTATTMYIFEPAIEEVLQYFEKEILGSLFVQTVNESNLSKFTARMISLNTTSNNINQRVEDLTKNIKVLEHRNMNKKQQDQLSSLALWTQ